MRSVDTIMLGYMSTTFNTGVYNVAAPTANLLTVAELAFSTIFLPVVTGLYAAKKMGELRKTYTTVTRWVFSTIFPCTLFTVLFAAEILGVMFGSEYASGAGALSILAVGYFMVSFFGPVRSMMESISQTKLILFNTLVATAINIALNLALIPPWGMNGASLATTISFFVWNLLSWLQVYRKLKMHPFSGAFLKPTIAACIAIMIFFGIKTALPPLESIAFPLDIALLTALGASFVGLYAMLFIVMKGLQPEDMEVLRAIENKTGIRVGFARNFVKRFSGK
jgi:O-antigen/teichoic acid export membrane protein